jgi:pilus assembly protein CpaC
MSSAFTNHLRRVRRATTARGTSIAALVVCIIVILVAAPQAQQTPAYTPLAASGGPAPAVDTPTDIDLLVGRSTIVNVGATIARVSLTVPDIADAMVTAPGQLLIHGKQPGTISLFVWDRGGAIKTYEVKVRRDLTALAAHLKQLFPGEPIDVRGSGKDVVLSGTVSSTYVREKAADVAGGYVEKKENVVNLLRQQEGVASNQVMLRVRFAEVSRSALQELGASFVSHGYKNEWFGRTTTGQFPAPEWDEEGRLVFSDFLNLFVLNTKEGLGGVVRALQNKGLFQSLAEPNLISTNGKEASFLAGGEFPYPVVQSGANSNAVTIMFKEFGIRLNFTPTVLGGDLINLKVRPEVSALDFANAVTIEGFRIPALSTRRTETEVELRDGQTFAIAGLMNNTLTNSMSKIPGIGDIPVLGLLFRSKAHQKNQTELVVMITPTIIRKGQTGVSEGLPSLVEPYMSAPSKRHPNPDPYVGSPRYPTNQKPQSSTNSKTGTQAQSAPKQESHPWPGSSAPSTSTAAPWPGSTQQPAARPTSTGVVTSVGEVSEPLASRPIQNAPAPSAPVVVSSAPVAATPTPAPVVVQIPGMQVDSTPAQGGPVPTPVPVAAAPGQSNVPSGPPPPVVHIASAPAPSAAAAPKAGSKSVESRKAAAEHEKRQNEQRQADARAAEQRRAQQAATDAKLKADQQKKDEEARKLAERLDKERTKREAEIAKKNAEIARKKAEEDAKREQGLTDAAARLREAQAAYQAQLEKSKGNSNDKTKSSKSSSQPRN